MKRSWKTKSRSKARFRDYHKRQYGNPLFPKQKRRRRISADRRRRGLTSRNVLVGAAVVLVGALVWYFLFSPAFRITELKIRGAQAATEGKIRDILEDRLAPRKMFVFPEANIFLFDKKGAVSAVEEYFYLDSIGISKKLPVTLIVDIKEIPKRAVFFEDGRFLVLSESGTVISELTEGDLQKLGDLPPDISSVMVRSLGAEVVELSDLDPFAAGAEGAPGRNKNEFPLLFDDDGGGLAAITARPGDSAFASHTVALILQANARLPDITEDAVRWFTVKERNEAVDVTMAGDWHLFLTTSLPFDVQVERLVLVLKEKIGQRKHELRYIDLRYNERIFYKFSGEGGD